MHGHAYPSVILNRRTLLRGLFAATLTTAAGVSLNEWDTHRLDVKTVPLTIGLQKPLRIIVLGDIHFDPVCDEAYVQRVIDEVSSHHPDLIVYLGDLMTEDSARCNDLAAILAQGRARFGSYAAIGNHEHLAGVDAVHQALEKNGIQVLLNQSMPLPLQDNFYLTGIDSYWGKPDPTVFARVPKNSRHILLAHEPDPFHRLNEPTVALQLSGHTHGGQVRLPFRGALHLPILGRKYDQGLFERDGRFLYVNRGIGTLPPHFRFDCPPEITVLELA